jgi:hypothetical protein
MISSRCRPIVPVPGIANVAPILDDSDDDDDWKWKEGTFINCNTLKLLVVVAAVAAIVDSLIHFAVLPSLSIVCYCCYHMLQIQT